MALFQCPECRKDVSSTAAGCPHCGYALIRPKTKRASAGCGFWLLLGAGGLFVLYLIGSNVGPTSPSKPGKMFGCGVYEADDLVEQMKKNGFFYKIEKSGGFPRIYVNDSWYLVPIDQKRLFDTILQCHVTRGRGDPLLGVYRDHRTGKEVATTGGAYGFEMK